MELLGQTQDLRTGTRTYVVINMLASLNSKERSLPEFLDIASQAGLKFVKVWKCVDMNIVEL